MIPRILVRRAGLAALASLRRREERDRRLVGNPRKR